MNSNKTENKGLVDAVANLAAHTISLAIQVAVVLGLFKVIIFVFSMIF